MKQFKFIERWLTVFTLVVLFASIVLLAAYGAVRLAERFGIC